MRPPAWLRERAVFSQTIIVQTRLRDLDHLLHVNNISLAGLYDEARYQAMQDIFRDLTIERVRIVTALSTVSYDAEVFYPAPVEIGTGILKIGRASFELGQGLFQNGVGMGSCVTVFVATGEAGSAPLPPELRAALERRLIHPPAQA